MPNSSEFNPIGKKILIIGDHPHTGEKGIIDRASKTAFGKVGLVIKLDNCPHGTEECFVFNARNVRYL